ncbi:hypothetical protein NHX12_021226, partial [Muraenolepis orangiensis]
QTAEKHCLFRQWKTPSSSSASRLTQAVTQGKGELIVPGSRRTGEALDQSADREGTAAAGEPTGERLPPTVRPDPPTLSELP